mmetsp:Transcript_12058/g.20421  ORF Transcript_12058/g.20421 Transcript_12058/m.20421 type:complete len:97 (+) Transcript_12058:697-987(+)
MMPEMRSIPVGYHDISQDDGDTFSDMMMPVAYLWHVPFRQSTCGCSAFMIPTSRASNNTIHNNCNTTKITRSMSGKEEQQPQLLLLLLLLKTSERA